MRIVCIAFIVFLILSFSLETFSHTTKNHNSESCDYPKYVMPAQIAPPGEKLILVNPNVHAWGAYSPEGTLIRAGMATAGSNWCRDLKRPCRTKTGQFRIKSLGSKGCRSSKFPVPKGGAPMPYCMFFNGGQALHGSYEVVRANISHGCVRLKVEDAEWIRFNFAEEPNENNDYRGTKVIIKPY